MKFDLIGKVKRTKLPTSNALLPLMEAIVNSIHATKFADIDNGLIDIIIKREANTLDLKTEGEVNSEPIAGFIVRDNGVGFNQENYDSFNRANSTYKLKYGAKGVGRFIWLKAFDNIRIESVFRSEIGNKKRSFDFNLSDEGIENHNLTSVNGSPKQTQIEFKNFKKKYKDACPRELSELANRILDHCLVYLVLENCPTIRLIDEKNNSEVVINDIFSENIKSLKKQKFKIKDFQFELDIYKVLNLITKHQLHFCANDREVYSKPLSKDIPELNRRLKSDETGEEFYLKAYIKGEYLDNIVNEERTNFNFPRENEAVDFPDSIKESDFTKYLLENLESSIKSILDEARDNKLEKIKNYVEKEAPQYRVLFKYKKDKLRKLPSQSSDKLELSLFKILHELEVETKKEGKNIFKKIKTVEDFEEYKGVYDDYIQKVIDVGKTNLSKYIIHRKTVIEILDKHLGADELGSHAKEDTIHKMIFPIKSSSDDIFFEDHNLWLIDEKLSYHTYLASDKRFDQIDVIDSDSKKRGDIIVFNDYFDNRFALSETKSAPFPSVVIIELKRPMRDDYKESDNNPIQQLYDYVDEIKNDKKKLKNNRLFNAKAIPFYCYLVCDLTEKIKKLATITHDLKPTPDGNGYFGYNSTLGAYIEIISYDKMLDDAKKRNQILFDKLKLPI